MSEDRDEDDLTPVESPQAKRSSGQHRMGDVPCPSCKQKPIACDLCVGANNRMVSLTVALKWREAHRDTDPAPPTERNDK
jgi:hypothetical protein